MTKQEEIREGTDAAFKHFVELIRSKPKRLDGELVKNMRKEYLAYLHSQGVVLKVACKKCKGLGKYWIRLADRVGSPHQKICVDCKGTGYEAVEPLIKEK